MTIKVIKTDDQYDSALAEVEALVSGDPRPGTADAERLELLTLVVQHYEVNRFPISMPRPVAAIKFRMEQLGLSPRDLAPYLGSRSKVSEVLSGKRPLTLRMIRALNKGLEIPATVLLQDQEYERLPDDEIEWSRFPLGEMARRGWITATRSDIKERAEELVREFLGSLAERNALAALYRKTDRTRSAMPMNRFALLAWTVRVFDRAADAEINVEYDRQVLNEDFMRELVRLSWFDDGPRLAREFLAKHGIKLVIEPQLPRTRLDGAAIMSEAGWPVVALTIRHDRIDNFWFSLIHELVHVMVHLGDSNASFYDDLDTDPSDDALETQADQLARDFLIPAAEWENSAANLIPSHDTVVQLADKLRIHPAIVAGRVRYDARNFKILHGVVGYRGVRRLFPEIEW